MRRQIQTGVIMDELYNEEDIGDVELENGEAAGRVPVPIARGRSELAYLDGGGDFQWDSGGGDVG